MGLTQIWNCFFICLLFLVHVKQVSCSVTHFLVALSTAAGANGLPGQNAPPTVEAGLRCGRVSVITPPLRTAAESVRALADSRKCVTLTTAQVGQCDDVIFHIYCFGNLFSLCTIALVDSVPWFDWSAWSVCTVSCGGGSQSRSRSCRTPPCSGMRRQSKTCNTQVCLGTSNVHSALHLSCEE